MDDSEEPDYKPVPAISPKTGEPPKQFVCMTCGVSVFSKAIHTRWHQHMSEELARARRGFHQWPPGV